LKGLNRPKLSTPIVCIHIYILFNINSNIKYENKNGKIDTVCVAGVGGYVIMVGWWMKEGD
jgi:hypothetical protein